jgi:serine/threonine protein kinase
MIEGYKFIRTLGSGGFGTVVLAEEEVSGKKVAIKKLGVIDKNDAFFETFCSSGQK